MTDEEYIRKSVELAEGWSARKGGQVISAGGYLGHIDDQEIQDALAAQLVRQIDSIDRVEFSSLQNSAMVWDFRAEPCRLVGTEEGPDRTENTIKACVQLYRERNDE